MPRPTNTAQRREQIVRGLLRIMAVRGYEGASIAAVARAARVAPGLVHYHFADKQEILVALVDVVARELVGRVARRVGGASGPRTGVDAFLEALVAPDPPDAPALACWLAIASEAPRLPAVRRAFDRAVAALVRQLEQLVRLALEPARAPRARAIAAELVTAAHGELLLAAAAPSARPRGSAAASLRAIAAGLLDVPTPAAPPA